jgi:hypothetical protein
MVTEVVDLTIAVGTDKQEHAVDSSAEAMRQDMLKSRRGVLALLGGHIWPLSRFSGAPKVVVAVVVVLSVDVTVVESTSVVVATQSVAVEVITLVVIVWTLQRVNKSFNCQSRLTQ